MTPDELHAHGYSLEIAAWGVRIIYEPVSKRMAAFTVYFERPLSLEDATQRGWEAAEVDLVKRRLTC